MEPGLEASFVYDPGRAGARGPRFTRPALLVDIGRLAELSYVRDAGASVAIGALTRRHDVHRAPLLLEYNPLVSYAAGLIGDPQVRHRGTIGGSLAHGDPASDLPAVLLALDAEIDIAGAGGVRTVAAADFFQGVFTTAAGPHELVTEVRVPKLTGDDGWSYLKFRRRAQDWATVGVALVAKRSNGGVESALHHDLPVRPCRRKEVVTERSSRARLSLRWLERRVLGAPRLHRSHDQSSQRDRHLPQAPLLVNSLAAREPNSHTTSSVRM